MNSPAAPTVFGTTHWTTVLQARDGSSAEGAAALERLCRTYWRPLYFFARRKGHPPEDAEDLVQGFFAKLLEKDYLRSVTEQSGRFRTFLLTAFTNYRANEWDRSQRLKRGGQCTLIPLDAGTAEDGYRLEPVDELTPEKLYDRHWGETVVELVADKLRSEYGQAGEAERFEALHTCLMGESSQDGYAALGTRLGLSEGGVKTVVRRMRLRFATLLRDELAQTLADPADVETEMRYLLEALVS